MIVNTQLKVVMVISQFYPELGGAEVQAQRLARALRKRGVDVSVLTRRLKGLPHHELIDGIPVYRAIKTIPLPFVWGLFFIVSTFHFLYKRKKDYTVIHCHILQEYQTVIAVLFKFIFRKKVIVKMSSSGLTSDIKLLHKKFYGKLFLSFARKVDAVISVCKQSSKEIVDNGFSRDILVEIPNGVNLHHYCKDASKPRNTWKTVTFIGRLDGYKGIAYLLNGFKALLLDIDKVRLLIVGTGPEETHLENLAEDLEINGHVEFRGKQENIPGILCETDIFVLPSLSEGMSNVLLEAMACGLPIVTTSVGGNSDMVRDRHNGLLVPPRDSDALREALVELLSNDVFARQLGAQARKTVEENYSLECITDSYLQLYTKLTT